MEGELLEEIEQFTTTLAQQTAFTPRQAQIYSLKKARFSNERVQEILEEIDNKTVTTRTIQNTFYDAKQRQETVGSSVNWLLFEDKVPSITLSTESYRLEDKEMEYRLVKHIMPNNKKSETLFGYAIVKKTLLDGSLEATKFMFAYKEDLEKSIVNNEYNSFLDVFAAAMLYKNVFGVSLTVTSVKDVSWAEDETTIKSLLEREELTEEQIQEFFSFSKRESDSIQVGRYRNSYIPALEQELPEVICFVGKIGAGTSFSLKSYLIEILEKHPEKHIFIIDVLNVAESLAKTYDGEKIDLKNGGEDIDLENNKLHWVKLDSKNVGERTQTEFIEFFTTVQDKLNERGEEAVIGIDESNFWIDKHPLVFERLKNIDCCTLALDAQALEPLLRVFDASECSWVIHRLEIFESDIQEQLELTDTMYTEICHLTSAMVGETFSEALWRNNDGRWVPIEIQPFWLKKILI